MLILLPICLYRVGGWDQLVARLPASSFEFTHIGWDTIATYFVIYFFGIMIGQDVWQRVFTARSERVAAVAGSLAGLYCVAYGLVGALVGMAARVLLPDLDNPNNAFAAIVQASLPDGIRGLVIAAALAAMMSTASAAMLAGSTVLAEDLVPLLRRGKPLADVRWHRLLTLLVGLAVLGIALVVDDVLNALTTAYNLLVGGMLVPLLGCATAVAFMVRDGLAANTPIYASLAVSTASFILISLALRAQQRPLPGITPETETP
jgi:SSS family solute:Na+ symporter